MINWPEMLHHAEDWAAGFWAGAGAADRISNSLFDESSTDDGSYTI